MTKFRVIEGTVWEIEAETLEEAKAIYDAYFIAGDGEELPIKEIQGDSYWYGTEYREGAQDTLCYLSDLYDGVEETDIWKDHFGEGASA